jgi:hypothetical protein
MRMSREGRWGRLPGLPKIAEIEKAKIYPGKQPSGN